MLKSFTFNHKLDEILMLQDFGANPQMYSSLKDGNGNAIKGHIGIDVNFGDEQPVYAICDGTVVYMNDATPDSIVVLTYPDTEGNCYEIVYSHGQKPLVEKGQRVKTGDVLCHQGSNGLTMLIDTETKEAWSHLHLGIRPCKIVPAGTALPHISWAFNYYSPIPYVPQNTDNGYEGFIDPAQFSQEVMIAVAKAFQVTEGWATPGETLGGVLYPLGSASYRNNNPGNIRSVEGPFLAFPAYPDPSGFDYLCAYLTRAVTGQHPAYVHFGPSISNLQVCSTFSPTTDGNDPVKKASTIQQLVGFKSIDEPAADWVLTEIEYLRKNNDERMLVYPQAIPVIDPNATAETQHQEEVQQELAIVQNTLVQKLKAWFSETVKQLHK